MASLSVTTTFSAGTTAVASEVNTNFTDIVNYVNNRNSASATWDAVSSLNASTVPIVGDNSTGTQAIMNLKDNGSTVFTVLDGGNVGIGISGPTAKLDVVGASAGIAAYIKPQGAITDNTDNAGVYILHQGSSGAALRVRTDQNLTGSDLSHIFLNNTSSGITCFKTENRGTGPIQKWLGVSGAEYGRFTSDGFLGLGQSSPSYRLEVSGASTAIATKITVNGSLADNTDNSGLYVLHAGTQGAAFRVRTDQNLTGSYFSHIYLNNTSSSVTALTVTTLGGGAAQVWQSGASQTVRATLTTGLQMGAAPTGGDKGAGTINCSGDIYKNDTAYTNPDYVLEWWATGKIEKFKENPGAADYPGVMPLDSLEAYIKEHFDLPRVKSVQVDGNGQGIFARGDIALEKIEEMAIYIIELHKRIKNLEGAA